MRGYCGVGLDNPKNAINVGSVLRAAGVYQAVEAVLQLRGEAGANQVSGAKTAITQALGGPASNVITHIFSRR